MNDQYRILRTLACILAMPCILSATHIQQAPAVSARQILAATGIKGGFVVHIGCGDGHLTATLGENDSFLVHGLDTDASSITKARQHIRSLGLYGRIS
ncbi:MAG: hypothetical protein ACYSUX_10495, partial [Planctomycetota bacterium]